MMAKLNINDLSPKEFRRLDELIIVDAGKLGKSTHIGQIKSIAYTFWIFHEDLRFS